MAITTVPTETSAAQQSILAAGDLTFSVNPKEAIISGKTYRMKTVQHQQQQLSTGKV